MHGFVHSTLEFIKLHQNWAFAVIFLVSFGESFIGLIPGTTILVIAGTLVDWPFNPHGVLNIWPVLIGAITGAVLGDGLSFTIGRRFGHAVEKLRFFVNRPNILKRGYAFFDRFGTASVFIGRFFGPVRAIIPLVAGIMAMPKGRFWIANVGSALVWAPALLLTGTILRRLAWVSGAAHGFRIVIAVLAAILLTTLFWLFQRYKVWNRIQAAMTKR